MKYTLILTLQKKVVALTFDDGPNKNTLEILGILKELDIKATFFVNGAAMERNLLFSKAIVNEGHDLANHSYSHQRIVFKSYNFIKNEIERTDSLIHAAGFTKEITFRPPHQKKLFVLPYYLNKHNRKTIMANLYPESYAEKPINADNMTKYVVDNIQPGSIILLHVMFRDESAKAIRGIVEGLHQKGYTFKTVTELLE